MNESMIEWLNGTIELVDKQRIVVNIHGVGISLAVPDGYQFKEQSSAKILTYVHWNTDQGPSLYGFSSIIDRSLFGLIIECSGIGPKLALALLGQLGSSTILKAVAAQNHAILASVSGIGTKKAEALVVQLKHKTSALAHHTDIPDILPWQELAQALESLSYAKHEISTAIHSVQKSQLPENPNFDLLLRKALTFLAK